MAEVGTSVTIVNYSKRTRITVTIVAANACRKDLFFSYETPVAGHTILDGYFKTDTYYSRTTSKHINQYLKHADSYVKTVTNDYIVSLCHPEGLGA